MVKSSWIIIRPPFFKSIWEYCFALHLRGFSIDYGLDDHKDNNPRNNSQKNCYLVCRNCHGKATKIEKRAVRDMFGGIAGYKTIKRKVSYKKPKSTVAKKKVTKGTPIKKVVIKSSKSTSVKGTRARRGTK